jgi:hypothetical protein
MLPLLKLAKRFRYRLARNWDKYPYIRGPDLAGGCGVASVLFLDLAKPLYPALRLIEGEYTPTGYHVWLQYHQNILDLTCTQYHGIVESYPRQPTVGWFHPKHPLYQYYQPTYPNVAYAIWSNRIPPELYLNWLTEFQG